MDAEPLEDFRALREMAMELNAEVARLGSVVGAWTAVQVKSAGPRAGRPGGSPPQPDALEQYGVIEAQDVTTVEVRSPEGIIYRINGMTP